MIEERTPTSNGNQILTFLEGDIWVKFDIVAQGKSQDKAIARLLKTIAMQEIVDAEFGKLFSFGSVPGGIWKTIPTMER